MNASEPREDAVADAFRALDEAIAYEGDCTARKGLRKARETFAALAQQGAEPVAQAAAFGGLNLGHGFLVTNCDLPSGAVYDLVPRGNVDATGAPR